MPDAHSSGWLAVAVTIVIGGSTAVVVSGETASPEWRVSARRARAENPIPPDAPSLTIGEKIYVEECLSCHGEAGGGDGPEARDLEKDVPDLRAQETWSQSDGALFWKITQGRRPMPGYRKLLTDEERWHVVNYTRALAPHAPASPDETQGK